jgi:hypothetical protein
MNVVYKYQVEPSRESTAHAYNFHNRRRVGGYYQTRSRDYREAVAAAAEVATYDARQNFYLFVLTSGVLVLMSVFGISKFYGYEFNVSALSDSEFRHTVVMQANDVASYRKPSKKFQYIKNQIQRANPSVDADRIARVIVQESALAGYDPFFIASIIFSESTFRPKVVSNMGAIGLMQLLPSTAKYIAQKEDINWKGVQSLYTVEYNIRLGIQYVQYLEDMFSGNRQLALMAYNWGPGNVRKSIRGRKSVLPQVRQYATKIIARHKRFQDAFVGLGAA